MRTIVYTALVAAVLSFSLGTGSAAAQDSGMSTCPNPGLVSRLSNIPSSADGLLPSVGKELAGIGLLARRSGCVIQVTCVGMDGSDAAREVAGSQCNVVRERLIAGGRTPSWGRDKFLSGRKAPGDGLMPGQVYIYFQ